MMNSRYSWAMTIEELRKSRGAIGGKLGRFPSTTYSYSAAETPRNGVSAAEYGWVVQRGKGQRRRETRHDSAPAPEIFKTFAAAARPI
ncbi:unnamed protein product [Nippostrongylus brasiliensis]|uniref:Uncharacterized protein n=1 Tax=Nippostrongylus brasiliensis TaxID=27835 RepID=A0A0N4YCW4_NIPBR|nr:unnamed protein product [Nippostrongylus brasiliensis]